MLLGSENTMFLCISMVFKDVSWESAKAACFH